MNLQINIDMSNVIASIKRERRRWTQLFDPSTHAEVKESIRREYRSEIRTAEDRQFFDKLVRDVPRLYESPESTIIQVKQAVAEHDIGENALVIAVMASGYQNGLEVYSCLLAAGLNAKLALVGYSTGFYDKTKVFRDGTSMIGKIYVPEWHLEEIAGHSSTVVFVDSVVDSGLTIATIATNLSAKVGISGAMYDTFDGINFESVNNHIKKFVKVPDVEIVTENCKAKQDKAFGELQRA